MAMVDAKRTTCADIVSSLSGEGGPMALGSHLAELKGWAARNGHRRTGARALYPMCVVYNEAVDATRNAPVLMYRDP